MTRKKKPLFRPETFLAEAGKGKQIAAFDKGKVIFAQGDAANAIFYIQKGKVKLTVVSNAGKEAVIAVLGTSDFAGERRPQYRTARSRGWRKPSWLRYFMKSLSFRSCCSPARALLLLANFGKDGKPEKVIPNVSQETVAMMIGTTRSRVRFS